MAKNFQYVLQGQGQAIVDSVLSGTDIHNTWSVFHKNPDDKGLWTVTSDGYLQITSNQNGLSGRYDPTMLTAKDYGFITELIPSGTDDDSFGIHFRYQNNFAFYFVAWDGGGEYNWGKDTLRLYKINGDTYQLLASAQIGHWVGGTKYQFEVSATGNHFVVKIDGVEHLNVIDEVSPYLQGAYGPCATSQVTTWTKLMTRGPKSFLVTTTIDAVVTIDNYSYETSGQISTSNVAALLQEVVAAYLGTSETGDYIDTYTIGTTDDAVEVYFTPSSPSKTTTDDEAYPYAYLKYDENPPSSPSNLVGTASISSITWTWEDTSHFEDGFQILDEADNVIAIVGKDVVTWIEAGLTQGTSYTRKVRAYNAYGVSESISAIAQTDTLPQTMTAPEAPKNLHGMTNSATQITWYWDPVEGAESYALYTADGILVMVTSSTKFVEMNLTPDTGYERYVIAQNIAGTSSPSNVVIAFTDVEQVIGDVPPAPLNLIGTTYGETQILWEWEAPILVIDPFYEDSTPKTQEEMDAEKATILESLSYRIYDANGEVLYEAPPNSFQYLESNLLPDTGYTHYVRAFTPSGESERSNPAYAKTDAQEIDDATDDVIEPEWPIEKVCVLSDKELDEKLVAFHSGIGDSLDLRVRSNQRGLAKERFSYDLQLKGYEYIPITVYPREEFTFRFRAEGVERLIVWTGEYLGKLRVYPKSKSSYKVAGTTEVPAAFSYNVQANARVAETVQSPISYTYTPYANVAYSKQTSVTTASMFEDATTKAVYGSNTWSYDPATDTVRGLQNVEWSGAYNVNHLTAKDYTFETDIGVMNNNSSGDNDMIGVAFRINKASDGKMRMYYFVSDRGDSDGIGIGMVWKLGKHKNQASGTWNWPMGGVELANSGIKGWMTNQWYHIKVEVTGPRIRIWLDGVLAVDVIDDDPDMVQGAFGPTNMSQIDFSAKGFTMNTLVPEQVTDSAFVNQTDTITDVNNSSNKKQLTAQTTASLLDNAIQNAYANYKAQAGNSEATLQIIDYGVSDTSGSVVTETAANGSGYVYAYVPGTTHVVVYHPVVVISDTFTDTITEAFVDASTNKLLQQTIGGNTNAYTAAEIMSSYITAYKASNGISDTDFFIDSYSALSLSTDTTVYTNSAGTDAIHAYTSAGTLYKGEKSYDVFLYAYQGWVVQSEPASAILLINKYGEVYTGSSNNVQYTLADLLENSFTPVAWVTTRATGTILGSDYVKVKTTALLETDISGVVDGKNPSYFFVDDLISIPSTAEYNEAHLSIQKNGVHDNPYFYFRTDDQKVSFGEEVFSYQRRNVLVISATSRVIEKPWIGRSEWYDGSVNGKAPYQKDRDGKKDLRVPIEVVASDDIEVTKWYVELNDAKGNITYVIENGVGDMTTKKNDYVTFSSDVLTNDVMEKIWYGPKITGETIYEVQEGETKVIRDKFLSPYKDAILSIKNITEWKLVATSKNPNVQVTVSNLFKPWATDTLFLEAELQARLINPTQTPWNPLIHNGFYYFNQKEYFLYSDTKIRGKYTQADGYQEVEFSYAVKVFCERLYDAALRTWADTNRSHFKGMVNNTDLDTSFGDIQLAKVAGDYADKGIYTSETKNLGAVVESWDAISWTSDEPFNSRISIEVSSYDGSAWSPWVAATNGNIMPLATTDQFRYRVTLEVGEETVKEFFTHKDEISSDFNAGLLVNTKVQSDALVISDTEIDQGTWLSPVFTLGGNITSLGTITYSPVLSGAIGDSVKVYTITSNDPAGPWDGTGEPFVLLDRVIDNGDGTKTGTILSAQGAYLRYQVRLTRGKENSSFTTSLSSGTDFSKGTLDNIAIDIAKFQLADTGRDGIFISAPLYMGHVTNFTTLSLESLLPLDSSIDVYTLSAAQKTDFTLLESNEANWKPINADGTIASLPNSYLKVKVVMKAGRTASSVKEITHSSQVDFNGTVNSNVTVTSSGLIQLTDNHRSGYYESRSLDFTTLETWETLSSVAQLNGGTVQIRTQTSNSNLGPWSDLTDLGPSGEILSPVANYIRYRIDLTPAVSDKAATYLDDTATKFQSGAIRNNAVYTGDGVGVTQSNASKSMTFTSGVKEFTDIKSYLQLTATEVLSSEATVSIYTKTSDDKVSWSSWQALAADGTIQSPAKRYLMYYINVSTGYDAPTLLSKTEGAKTQFTNGYFDNTETTVSNGKDAVVLTDVSLVGNFYSDTLDFNGRVTAWDTIAVQDLLPEVNGDVRVFTISSNVQTDVAYDSLSAAQAKTWVEATGGMIQSPPGRYLAYRIELTAGQTASVDVSPEVYSITVETTGTGGEPFKVSTVRDIQIDYRQKTYTGPQVDSITVTGDVYTKLSPVVESIFINADVYYWRSPALENISIISELYDIVLHTPVLHDITYKASLPSTTTEEEYAVSLMGTVLSDQSSHQVSTKTMRALIDNYMAEFGVNESNLTRKRYSLVSSVPGIFVEVKENNAPVYYESGESEIYAYTTDAATETIYSQAKVIVNENNEALVTPIPQQGAPIVVKDASGKELRHVTFLDKNGELTLTHTEEFEATGKREFTLTYQDIDLDTLEIWVDENLTNVYTKVEEYLVCNNEVTTKYTYAKGTPIRIHYSLVNSYFVDYNYNVKENYAMIKLHRPVLTDTRDITVRYETNTETAYYDAQEINLNPMQSLLNEGFLYLTDEVKPAKRLDVFFNPTVLHANGYDRTTILVVARDEEGNPVVGDIINFFVPDGALVINQAVTDVNGVAIATYITGITPNDIELTVVDRTSKIETKKVIHVRSPKAKPRITLELNKSVVAPDNMDKVKITARVVGETQGPSVDTLVLFQSTEGILLNTTDNTNYLGEAYAYIQTKAVPENGIITITVDVPDLALKEYVNLRVSEVVPFV